MGALALPVASQLPATAPISDWDVAKDWARYSVRIVNSATMPALAIATMATTSVQFLGGGTWDVELVRK